MSPSSGPCGVSMELSSTECLHKHIALLGWLGAQIYELAPGSIMESCLSGCLELHMGLVLLCT